MRWIGTVCLLALAGAAVASATTAPPLKMAKLTACFQLRGGLPDRTGIRSTAFSYGVDQDPSVVALVVLSGKNPRPSVPTAIVTKNRKPVLTKLFANVRINAYVFHRNGVTPLPGAMTAATAFVSQIVTACTRAAR
jgi:hypothetical protein